MAAPPFNPHSQNYFSRNHHSRKLPPPHELSSRVEEARTSAQLLSQTVQSTPPSELLQNELVREFADRCQSASRSVQAYMVAENPSPDNNTMETLIETNELLGKAMSQHQRAVLSARKAMGLGSGTTPPVSTDSGFQAPPGPPPNRTKPPPAPVPRKAAPPVPPPGDYAPTGSDDENPFTDPSERVPKKTHEPPFPEDRPSEATGQFNDRLGIEPWHPGFRETKSYVGRQDESAGGLTMHSAVAELESTAEREKVDEEPTGYGTKAGTKAPVYRY